MRTGRPLYAPRETTLISQRDRHYADLAAIETTPCLENTLVQRLSSHTKCDAHKRGAVLK